MGLDAAHLEILNELVDCATAMGAYREDAVVTGGLVPLLYRFDSRFASPRQPPLMTGDMDFTVPAELPVRGDARLVDVLEQGRFVVVPSRKVRADLPAKHFIQHERHGREDLAPFLAADGASMLVHLTVDYHQRGCPTRIWDEGNVGKPGRPTLR